MRKFIKNQPTQSTRKTLIAFVLLAVALLGLGAGPPVAIAQEEPPARLNSRCNGNFCPFDPVNRTQMAIFLTRNFGFP